MNWIALLIGATAYVVLSTFVSIVSLKNVYRDVPDFKVSKLLSRNRGLSLLLVLCDLLSGVGATLALLSFKNASIDVPNVTLNAPTIGLYEYCALWSGVTGAVVASLNNGRYISRPDQASILEHARAAVLLAFSLLFSWRRKMMLRLRLDPIASGQAARRINRSVLQFDSMVSNDLKKARDLPRCLRRYYRATGHPPDAKLEELLAEWDALPSNPSRTQQRRILRIMAGRIAVLMDGDAPDIERALEWTIWPTA